VMFLDAAPHILAQRPAMSTVKKFLLKVGLGCICSAPSSRNCWRAAKRHLSPKRYSHWIC
jgi:hypothetical protein